MPGPGRRLEVDVVDADAGPADDHEPGPGGDQRRVDLHLAPDDERVVVGQDRRDLLVGEAELLVDLVVAAEELQALGRQRLDDEDPHQATPAGVRTGASSACWAAVTATPGATSRPSSTSAASSVPERGEHVVRGHRRRGGRAGRSGP